MQLDKLNVLSIDTDWVTSPYHFTKLFNFYLNYIDKIDLKNICFSQIHANIFHTLEPLYQSKKTIDLISIDHHHDYNLPNGHVPTKSFASHNWLGYYLSKKNFINNVFWLANYDSQRGLFNDGDILNVTYDIDEVKLDNFDYIFVCNSPSYSNLISECLFNSLIEVTKSFKKCDKFDFYKPNLITHQSREIYLNDF